MHFEGLQAFSSLHRLKKKKCAQLLSKVVSMGLSIFQEEMTLIICLKNSSVDIHVIDKKSTIVL